MCYGGWVFWGVRFAGGILAVAGDDVDDRQHSAAAIERGPCTFHELDAVDAFDIDLFDEEAAVSRLIDRHAVDECKNPRSEISRHGESAHSQGRPLAGRVIEARQRRQGFGNVAISEALDVVTRQYGDIGGRLGNRLHITGSRKHMVLLLQQVEKVSVLSRLRV